MTEQTVFVATYTYQYGSDIRVFRKREQADAWANSIANEYFIDEFPDEDIPAPEEMGDTYFALMSDRDSGEYFEVSERYVEGD